MDPDSDVLYRGGSVLTNITECIADLQENGCNMLITGKVSEETITTATSRFLGAADEPRKRILALTDSSTQNIDDRFPATIGLGDPDVWLIDQRYGQRTVVSPPQTAAGMESTVGPHAIGKCESDLDALRRDISDAIANFASSPTGLTPSELRLSVDSLNILLEENDLQEVETFVRLVSAAVEEYAGMAHYFLPVDSDAEQVRKLLPYFDVEVELRKRDGLEPEQRWHLPDCDQKTQWFRLQTS
jgi:hypothetical protein